MQAPLVARGRRTSATVFFRLRFSVGRVRTGRMPALVRIATVCVVVSGVSGSARAYAPATGIRPVAGSPARILASQEETTGPTVSIADASALEGSEELLFPVRLSGATTEPVTVDYGTVDGTAEVWADYEETYGTLTFAPGERQHTIRVVLVDDGVDELDETFVVELYGATGATVSDHSGTGTILNDDTPELNVRDVRARESVGRMAFTLRLSGPAARPVTGLVGTAPGTAARGADYLRVKRRFRMEPGVLEKRVTVAVLDDALDEDEETFSLSVSELEGATEGDLEAVGTIRDNDPEPKVFVLSASVREDSGELAFPVRLGVPSGREVTVEYLTVDGAAVEGEDFQEVSGMLVFGPSEVTKLVRVPLLADALHEHDETFFLKLTGATNATLSQRAAFGTIENDDAEPLLSVPDARARESAGEMEFRATLDAVSGVDLSWHWATADGEALADEDYEPQRMELVIPAGSTEALLHVPLVDDAADEAQERFTVSLRNPRTGTAGTVVATGTIDDDDANERVVRLWITRFGRTVATQVVDAVGDRFGGVSQRGTHLSLGVDPMQEFAPAAGGQMPGAGWGQAVEAGSGTRGFDHRAVLARSSFLVRQDGEATPAAGRWAIWGRGAALSFSAGEDGGVAVDGDVLTAAAGVDFERGRLLAGLLLAHSWGDGRFEVAGSERTGTTRAGPTRSTLASANPYLRLALNERVSVWGLGGYGTGTMRLEEGEGVSDLRMTLGALGMRADVWPGVGGSSMNLALKSDLFWVRMRSGATAVRLPSTGAAGRARVLLEGAWRAGSLWGAEWVPHVAGGLRRDGGDAETGTGVEVGTGLRVHHRDHGLTFELSARSLVAHRADAYREWGLGGSLRLEPGRDRRGLSMQLASSRGSAMSGVSELWSGREPIVVRTPFGRGGPGQLEAELGYGFAALGRGSLTPFAAFGWQDTGGRAYRMGGRLLLGRSLRLSLAGDRREYVGLPPSYRLALQGSLR